VDRRAKLLATLSIVAVGATLAFFFRREASDVWNEKKADSPPAVIQTSVRPSSGRAPGFSPQQEISAVERARPVFDESQLTTPSSLQWRLPVYSQVEPAAHPSADVSVSRPDNAVRRHKITNGDSLPGLAQRYLGSADRFLEIFQFNREILSHPDVLPIDLEIRIPPRQQGSSEPLVPRRPSVPIAPAPSKPPGRIPLRLAPREPPEHLGDRYGTLTKNGDELSR